MKFASLLSAGLLAVSSVLAGPTPIKADLSQKRWANDFVTTDGPNFIVNGQPFFFLSENVFWLTQVNADADIVKTLTNIQAEGATVVRIWCFREVVGEAPSNPATYTSLWQNGNRTFNQPGIDRIRFILDTAQSLGLYAQCVLNNNWAPTFPANSPRPLGYYSNSFGGIDTYVQQINPGGDHDEFYTQPSVVQAYNDFLSFIVPQLANHTALFNWELANDIRCQGAEGTTTSPNCIPQTITLWVRQAAAHLKTLDPNHLVASGDAGFMCVGCPKLNPIPAAPATITGGGAGAAARRGRSRRGSGGGFLTWEILDEQNKALAKRAAKAARNAPGAKKNVRSIWGAPKVSREDYIFRRQSDSSASAYDGSAGVDSEDISNDPNIGLSTFQLVPDQNTLSSSPSSKKRQDSSGGPAGGTGGNNFESTVQTGIQWILNHAQSANTVSKPTQLTAFGLVNDQTQQSFVPFDSTGSDSSPAKRATQQFATVQQQGTAYSSWLSTAVNSGVNGIGHYQNTQTGLTSEKGTVIDDSNTSGDAGNQAPGESPSDGYETTDANILNILSAAASSQNAKSGSDSS